ncbi:hypothetical protein Tco_1417903 [Tanacetum coccineum]
MNLVVYELYWTILSRNKNPVAAKQVALDNSLVPPEKRLKIEKCNARIEFSKPQREETYQVTLDALKLSPCYLAFLITAEVPEVYMHQFWNIIQKIKDTYAYRFKLDKKKCRIDTEVFREILQICPRLLNQDFVEPPSEDELVSFIQELGYSGKCDMLSAIHTNQMHQPWRTFKNVDFVALLLEEFMFQADNREISLARKEHMPYPRFTKVIINHFISKDKTISMRNRINLHTIRDDTLLGTLKFVSKTQDYQQYKVLIPNEMINQHIKYSKAYKTYLDFATGKATPKKARKFKKVVSPSRKLSPVLEEEHVVKPKRVKRSAKKSTIVPTAGVVIRDTPTLLEAARLKKTLKKSKMETHKLHASGSGDGVGSQPKVLDEQEDKTTSTDEGNGTKLWVPDVPKYLSESENESWGDSGDDESNNDDSDEITKDDDEDDVKSDADDDNEASDSEKTDSDEDENPNLNQNDDEKEDHEEELQATKHEEEGKRDEEMTDVGPDEGTQRTTYEQVNDDEHVLHEEPSTQTPPLLNIPVTVIPETSSAAGSTIPLTIPPITPL